MTILALLVLLALPLSAQETDVFTEIKVHSGKFALIGWNKACSVAVTNFGYPKLGEAIVGDPLQTRIGTLTIPPGEERTKTSWKVTWDGRGTWLPDLAQKAVKDLEGAGYTLPGYQEPIKPGRYEGDAELARLLLSTETFKTKVPPSPFKPKSGFKLAFVLYSPLTSGCGLLVYSSGGEQGPFEARLIRIYNPGAREARAKGHISAADRLYGNGDASGAIEETAVAAALAPQSAAARYSHAAMLGRFGYRAQALPELEAALELEAGLKAKARKDEDFDSLRGEPRFKELLTP